MGGGGAYAGRWQYFSSFELAQQGIGTPLVPFPGPAVPPAPKRVESLNIPDSPPEQETVLKHTGRGSGRTVPRVGSAGRRRSLIGLPLLFRRGRAVTKSDRARKPRVS